MRCNALFIMEIANMRGTLSRKKYLKDKGFLTAILEGLLVLEGTA
jgi:hypothetical protein